MDDVPRVRLAFTAGTEFPIDLETAARLEVPYRVRFTLGVGVLPEPYVSAINGFLVGIDAYGDATADLIASTLSSSFVLRAHARYRFFRTAASTQTRDVAS